MLRSVLAKTLHDHQRGLVGWSIGLFLLVAMQLAVYPSLRDQAAGLNDLLENYPETFKAFFGIEDGTDFASPVGYLEGETFGFMIPLLFLIFAIGRGMRVVAGEEDQGTLELLLAQPVTRRRVVLEKVAALTAMVAALGVVLFTVLALGVLAVDMDLGVDRIAAAAATTALLGWVFGALALFVGAATGSRGLAVGVAGAAAVASYLLNSLGRLVDVLEPLRPFSPYYLYEAGRPLRHGLDPLYAPVLAALAVVFVVAAVVTFDRRDLSSP